MPKKFWGLFQTIYEKARSLLLTHRGYVYNIKAYILLLFTLFCYPQIMVFGLFLNPSYWIRFKEILLAPLKLTPSPNIKGGEYKVLEECLQSHERLNPS